MSNTHLRASAEMQKAFDGWCSFSKLCLRHFRCIQPTSFFGLCVFNFNTQACQGEARRWMGTPLPLLAGWKGKTRWEGSGVFVWIRTEYEEHPYKEKQTRQEKRRHHNRNREDEKRGDRGRKVVFGDEKWSGRGENNEWDRQKKGGGVDFDSQWI